MKKLLWLILLGTTLHCTPPENNEQAMTDQPTAFAEQHRPQFHFSPDSMWMNDPNGMVYYEGEYHLFYQHYPDSTVWGPMHWGHAVSTDLVHWEHLPIALYPDSLGYIFSGSAVVDWNNTSGLGTTENPPLIAIFTHHDPEGAEAGTDTYQYQSIAYSTDNGRSWTKYQGNPVVPNPGIRDFRDPKVFWHGPSEKWVMIFAAADRVRLYTSLDLKSWEFASEFGADAGSHGGVWECPDLFELPVQGTDESRWVLLLSINPGGPNGGSATQYFLGDFDGKTFTNDNPPETTLWVDYGKDNYAGVTWSDVPEEDGRRLFIGWMSNWQYANVVPTDRWRSAMTVPRSLHLVETEAGIRLVNRPVQELQQLRSEELSFSDQQTLSLEKPMVELLLEVEKTADWPEEFGVRLSNEQGEEVLIGYETASNQYFIDRTQAGKTDFNEHFAQERHYAPRISTGETITLHLLVDVASVELFADGGLTVLTDIFFPAEDFTTVAFYAKNGELPSLQQSESYALSSIWK